LYHPVFPLLLNQLEQDIELSIPGLCPAHTLVAVKVCTVGEVVVEEEVEILTLAQ
jgi:hypothetical protein